MTKAVWYATYNASGIVINKGVFKKIKVVLKCVLLLLFNHAVCIFYMWKDTKRMCVGGVDGWICIKRAVFADQQTSVMISQDSIKIWMQSQFQFKQTKWDKLLS